MSSLSSAGCECARAFMMAKSGGIVVLECVGGCRQLLALSKNIAFKDKSSTDN